MTQRLPETLIEAATSHVMCSLNEAISYHYQIHKPGLPEKEFRRILAGYFERQSMQDWCHLLGIEVPEGDRLR